MRKRKLRKFNYDVSFDVVERFLDGMSSSVKVYDPPKIGYMMGEIPSYRLDAEAVRGDVERAKERFDRNFRRYGSAKAG